MRNRLTRRFVYLRPYIPALRKAMIRFAHPTPFLKWGSYGADDKIEIKSKISIDVDKPKKQTYVLHYRK